ncbi:hypothetical protein U1Q18_003433 [Sarracenia purpurea var. burkii]
MRLEGVRRGSTTLGYFDIDANDAITRTISSQAFRQDQGDLLFVGYGDGHVTVWDVQKGSACLLDGQTTGKVLCASPLLSDESCGGALLSSQGNITSSGSSIGSMTGGVLGADSGRKLLNKKFSSVEEGVVIFATYQNALAARVSPSVVVYAQVSKPDGVHKGSMLYTAWKCMGQQHSSSTGVDNRVSWNFILREF